MQKLHYENIGGMLVRREGMLNWECPDCGSRGHSENVMEVCPDCRNEPVKSVKSMKSAKVIYGIYYGMTVPFQCETFTSWGAAILFMKRQLDAGIEIHSVYKELL